MADSGVITLSNLVLEPDGRSCVYRGSPIRLTGLEFDLLFEFARRSGQLVGKDYLITKYWGGFRGSNVLTVHVGNIRRKLGWDPTGPLKSEWSLGYRLDPAGL